VQYVIGSYSFQFQEIRGLFPVKLLANGGIEEIRVAKNPKMNGMPSYKILSGCSLWGRGSAEAD
jgi:hypothetical protein